MRECGTGDLTNINENNAVYISKSIQITLNDQFIQTWQNQVQNSAKCSTLYKHVKHVFGVEEYLIRLPDNLRISLCKLRTSNHKLPIETGRYMNINKQDRICTMCNNNDIGDEYHLVMECKNHKVVQIRKNTLTKTLL